MKVIIEFPDDRIMESTEEGFAEYHKPYGAKIIAYVGADGRNYPADADGKRQAQKAYSPNWSELNQEVADRQADVVNTRTVTTAVKDKE